MIVLFRSLTLKLHIWSPNLLIKSHEVWITFVLWWTCVAANYAPGMWSPRVIPLGFSRANNLYLFLSQVFQRRERGKEMFYLLQKKKRWAHHDTKKQDAEHYYFAPGDRYTLKMKGALKTVTDGKNKEFTCWNRKKLKGHRPLLCQKHKLENWTTTYLIFLKCILCQMAKTYVLVHIFFRKWHLISRKNPKGQTQIDNYESPTIFF